MSFATLTISAQNGDRNIKEQRKELKENHSPEQRAELFSKKMTLNLDLNDNQQEQVKELLLKMKKEKPNFSKNKKEMTAAEKFEFKKDRMNRRIALKRELKKILTPGQYEKWDGSKKGKGFNSNRFSRKEGRH